MSTNPSSFGTPRKTAGTRTTTTGRLIYALLFGAVLVFGYLGYSAISKKLAQSKTSATASGQSTPSSSGGFMSNFFGDTMNVCVVTWGGYAGGEYNNDGFKAGPNSRYTMKVEFKLIDDVPASRKAWEADQCDVLWATTDSLPAEIEGFVNAGHGPKQFFQSDWSRGGDVIVVVRGINSVADLRGKKIAVAIASPSHTFLLRTLQAQGMGYNDVQVVQVGSAIEAAAQFKSGNVDAAVVWSPDDDDALKNVKGSKRLTSTKEATHIIADVFIAKEAYIESHRDQLVELVTGWMTGAAEINSNPKAFDRAVQILSEGLGQPPEFVANAIRNARLTTIGDNLNYFNVNGTFTGVTGEDIYMQTGKLYQQIGLAPANLPNWRTITDTSIIRAVAAKLPATGANAAEGGFSFERPTPAQAVAPALSTRRLTVTFPTGSSTLGEDSKQLIDLGFGETLSSFQGARVRIEGNTDDVGPDDNNLQLSRRRANSVADYLVSEYGFDRNRFIVTGNGESKPVPGCEGDTTDACRAKNRRTDFEILN